MRTYNAKRKNKRMNEHNKINPSQINDRTNRQGKARPSKGQSRTNKGFGCDNPPNPHTMQSPPVVFVHARLV